MSWFGKAEQKPETPPKAVAPVEVEEPTIKRDLTPEEKHEQKVASIRSKLKDELKYKTQPGAHFNYDKLFRFASRVLMEQHGMGDTSEGIALTTARQTMNVSFTSKYHLHSPQQSAWDMTLQMHGFSDFVSASFSTLGRYQLMYQRVFKCGAVAVGQWMVQPSPMAPGGVPPGNFFGMIEYPWRVHGASSLTYLKGQHVCFSHTERLVRGLYVGSQMTYDLNTHNTSQTWGVQATTSDKKTIVAAELKDGGDVRVSMLKKDWAADSEFVLDIDYAERKNGAATSSLNMGVRRNLFGGGSLAIALANFTKVRGVLELPFGLDRAGLNQVRVAYNVAYDAMQGGVKQGLVFTL